MLSTFDGLSTARTWVRKLEAFFLLHPVAGKEAIEISTLHLEGEAYDWWSSHLSHARERNFAKFIQRLVKTFDVKRKIKGRLHHHLRRLVIRLSHS